MASVRVEAIESIETPVHLGDKVSEASGSTKVYTSSSDTINLLSYTTEFSALAGNSPTHSLLLSTDSTSKNPFFHECCVYLPDHDELYITSNLLATASSSAFPTILISRIRLHRSQGLHGVDHVTSLDWSKLRPPPGIDMPNGGTNYQDSGILFCAQGTDKPGTGGIYLLPRAAPPRPVVTNYRGVDFNSPNDVVVAQDGTIWFTDPAYGAAQDFRRGPRLPNQVYCFSPATGDIRVVADAFVMPNGICFSPDEKTVYITDTGAVAGDGTRDLAGPATIYAFDKTIYHGSPFLINRRVFAYVTDGVPDGIKTDVLGNIYSGCGDGVNVWSPAGLLIGKILVGGGVANFCFGRNGELFLCNETRLWRVSLDGETKGALLGI